MPDKELSVVIPAYLEEQNLQFLLPRLRKTLDNLKTTYEVLIIDAKENLDHTLDVCLESGCTHINREKGNSYGDAVRTGIKKSRGRYIVFMDADGSHAPEFIKKLFVLRKEYDVVIASRYIHGGSTDNKKILIFLSWLVNYIYKIILNIPCRDISNSYKLYDAQKLKEIILESNNFDIVEEILFKLLKKYRSLRIKEIPFSFKERMFGHTKRNLLAFSFSYLISLIKLKYFLKK